jgi:copper chaperone
VATVTPFLNQEKSIEKWQIDTTNPNKILTVKGTVVNEENVIEAIVKAGFKIEPLE